MKIKLYRGDCLEVMPLIEKKTVDLVFTSPPYNLGISSGGGLKGATKTGKWKNSSLANGYDSFNDALPYCEYREWQNKVLTACWETLSDKGAIFYNHKPRIQNGCLQTPLDLIPKELSQYLRQIVIWKRSGGINFSPSFYLPTHEWVVILAKPDFRLKSIGASGAKDVWEVPQSRNKSHPAPFPVELVEIALETTNSKIVLDPFMGSGTTGVACKRFGRDFIGIELSKKYFELSEKRINCPVQRKIL